MALAPLDHLALPASKPPSGPPFVGCVAETKAKVVAEVMGGAAANVVAEIMADEVVKVVARVVT